MLLSLNEQLDKPRVAVDSMNDSFIKLYNLEQYILVDVRKKFLQDGHINAFDFFCIIIWKANRAKTKIAQRLMNRNKNLEESVRELTSAIFSASENKMKLEVLICDYGFRLPMASAILSLLYPDDFTVYDIRVCDTFPDFKTIDNISNFDTKWARYLEYLESVRTYQDSHLSLRDKDRFLWGKSFHEQLTDDIKRSFKNKK